MQNHDDKADPIPTADPISKAEEFFLQAGTLQHLSVRVNRATGRRTLSFGEDGEDGMAAYRRMESAKRRDWDS